MEVGVNDPFHNWEEKSASVRAALDMPPDIKPWTATHKLMGVPPVPRYHDLLDIGYFALLKQLPPDRSKDLYDALNNWFCDLSQSCDHRPWCEGMGTQTTRALWYSYGTDRVVTTEQHYSIMGWPSSVDLGYLSNNELHDLIGESIHLPCLATVLFPLYLSPWQPWWGAAQAAAVRAKLIKPEEKPLTKPPSKRFRRTSCSGQGLWRP